MSPRLSLTLFACAALAACSTLLPRGSTDTPAGFASFEEAQTALQRVVALKTPTSELASLGFDPVGGANVTLIPYPDIVARLAPNSAVPMDKLDTGIRMCIEAQGGCRGYVFHFERQDRKRKGSFWLDFLNVRRTTYVTGWWFDALIVVTDGNGAVPQLRGTGQHGQGRQAVQSARPVPARGRIRRVCAHPLT